MEKDMRDTLQATSIEGVSKMGRLMVVEFMNGGMVKSMMENGQMELRKDKDSGRILRETITLVNGRIPKLMGMAFISGLMGINMKANGSAS